MLVSCITCAPLANLASCCPRQQCRGAFNGLAALQSLHAQCNTTMLCSVATLMLDLCQADDHNRLHSHCERFSQFAANRGLELQGLHAH